MGIFYGSGEGGGGGSCTYASSFGLQYSSNAHGSINLAESSARQYGGTATSQVLPFEYDLFSMNNKGLVLFNADVSLFKTTYDWGNMSCTPIDWFGIETSAGLTTDKGLHLGAMAYIMSGSLSFSIGTLNFTFDGYLGGIGAEAAFRPGFVTVGWAKGVGWGFTVEWDT